MKSMRMISAVLALAMILAACSSKSDGGSDTAGSKTKVSVMVAGDPEELKAFEDIVEQFNQEQSDIEASLVEIADSDEMMTKLSTSIAGDAAPNAFVMNYRYIGQFQSKGALTPVGQLLDSSSALKESDFYPGALDAFRFDGVLTCLPMNVSSLVLYYNKDLFAAANLKVPSEGWTWDDMVHAAQVLTTGKGADKVYGLGVDPQIIRIAPFIWSNGGRVVDSETAPTTFTLSEPKSLHAVQQFFDLRPLGLVPTAAEADSEDFESRFLNGRLGMIMESRKVVPAFRTITDFGWDVAQLPVIGEPATILHSDAYCMPAAAGNQDATWSFLEFALGERGQQIAVATGRTVPSLKSVAESPAFLDPNAVPANAQAFLDNIPIIQRVPHISTWPEIEDTANGMIEEGFYAGGEATEVAVAVDQATKPMFARAAEG